jgi:hypothetical protein
METQLAGGAAVATAAERAALATAAEGAAAAEVKEKAAGVKAVAMAAVFDGGGVCQRRRQAWRWWRWQRCLMVIVFA